MMKLFTLLKYRLKHIEKILFRVAIVCMPNDPTGDQADDMHTPIPLFNCAEFVYCNMVYLHFEVSPTDSNGSPVYQATADVGPVNNSPDNRLNRHSVARALRRRR